MRILNGYSIPAILFILLQTANAAALPCSDYQSESPVQLPAILEETSGLATSRVNPQFYWTHGDSGGLPEIYLINGKGALVHTYVIENAKNIDWEDIATGPCEKNSSDSCVYIADTGDNLNKRTDKKVLIVKEPAIPDNIDTQQGKTTLKLYKSVDVHFPQTLDKAFSPKPNDDARFINPDCESIMVSPQAEIYLISKQSPSSMAERATQGYFLQGLYHLRRSGKHAGTTKLLATYDFAASSGLGAHLQLYNAVTAADFAPNGKSFAIRTYSEIYLYDLTAYPNIADAFTHPSLSVASSELQGEAVAYMADGRSLITSSEKGPLSQGSPTITIHACASPIDEPELPPIQDPDPYEDAGNSDACASLTLSASAPFPMLVISLFLALCIALRYKKCS